VRGLLEHRPVNRGEHVLASDVLGDEADVGVLRMSHGERHADGFLPAVITGFLFTAIPNWTGRLPLRGRPLIFLVALWIAGRAFVTFSAETGWLAAMLIDCSFLLLIAAAAAREIIAGRKWNNLSIVVLILVLLAGNVAFHLEAHFKGGAEYSTRVGIGVVVLLISLIGGRIIPSFTRNWLVKENPGRLPVPFAHFDMVCVAAGAIALVCWIVSPAAIWTGYVLAAAGVLHLVRLARWAGYRTGRERLAYPSRRLCLRADRIPAERLQRLRYRSGRRRDPCLDGRSGGHRDAGGDEPGLAWTHRSAVDRIGRDAGSLCLDLRRRRGAHLRGPRAGSQRTAAARRSVRLGCRVPRLRRLLWPLAGRLASPGANACGGVMESRRATLVDEISRQTGVTDAMIAALVDTFYRAETVARDYLRGRSSARAAIISLRLCQT
jgi:NnrS protein